MITKSAGNDPKALPYALTKLGRKCYLSYQVIPSNYEETKAILHMQIATIIKDL